MLVNHLLFLSAYKSSHTYLSTTTPTSNSYQATHLAGPLGFSSTVRPTAHKPWISRKALLIVHPERHPTTLYPNAYPPPCLCPYPSTLPLLSLSHSRPFLLNPYSILSGPCSINLLPFSSRPPRTVFPTLTLLVQTSDIMGRLL